MARGKTVEIQPTAGGKLMSGASANVAGLNHYTEKLNFRRSLDSENQREGWDEFAPSGAGVGNQPLDADGPVDLIFEFKRPNGESAIIAASEGRLYRFYGGYSEGGDLYVESDYVEDGYFAESAWSFQWRVIATGLAHGPGIRYKAEALNGYAVINNGKDLPHLYRVEWDAAVPMRELREIGVISAGAMAVYDNRLFLFNLVQARDTYLAAMMNGPFPYGRKESGDGDLFRTGYAMLWSHSGEPGRHAPLISGAISEGDNIFYAAHPALSFIAGQEVAISGAGLDGSALLTMIESVGPFGKSFRLVDEAVTGADESTMQAADMLGTDAGGMDVQEDGSEIIAAAVLREYLVAYRETGYGVITPSLASGSPYSYQRFYTGKRVPHFRHTLISVRDGYHLFASYNGVYSVDLRVMEPKVIPEFQFGPPFWQGASHIANLIFAAEVPETREVWLCLPDKTYCLEYENMTLSEIDQAFSCVGVCDKPQTPEEVAAPQWVLLGLESGKIARYGLAYDGGAAVYNRLGEGYGWALASGLGDFGDPYNEKDVRGYLPVFATRSAAASVTLEIFGAETPDQEPELVASTELTDPGARPYFPIWGRSTYFKDRISGFGKDAPVSISARVWEGSFNRSRSGPKARDRSS